MKVSKRLADKMRSFEALAAYANMGDQPGEWKKFRLMYPDFFPVTSGFAQKGFENLDSWMYDFADEWHKDFSDLPPGVILLPPLLWYRNRLRAVWARNDQHGYCLAILLGFEDEAARVAAEHRGAVSFEPIARPSVVPGQPIAEEKSHGLPQGQPAINGVTGAITWEFGCEIQRAVYELMQERWRAKICPQCGRYFVAMKTAQKVCSAACSGDAARRRALTWWNQTGKKRREKARAQ